MTSPQLLETPVYTFALDGSEQLVLLKKAGPIFEKIGGQRPHVSALRRWRKHGIGAAHVRLPAVCVGGRWMTSAGAIQHFIVATTVAANAEREQAPIEGAPLTAAEGAPLGLTGMVPRAAV